MTIESMLAKPGIQRTALGELALACDEGAPLTKYEIVDTVLTMLLAGQFTTKDGIAHMVLCLARQPAIAEQIAAEASLPYTSIEEDSVTLRFITEVLRIFPPAEALQRIHATRDIDLGSAGCVPKGCAMAAMLNDDFYDSVDVGNPVFQDSAAARDKLQQPFGGKQPHACVGKGLALLEFQVFLRELCSGYHVEVVEEIYEPRSTGDAWRGDLPVRLTKRLQQASRMG